VSALYELTDEYAAILRELDIYAEEHEGEITDFPLAERLNALTGERSAKVLNVAVAIKSLEAWADAHADEAKSQKKKAEALNKKAERLRAYVEANTKPSEKFKDSRAQVWWQKNTPSVVIDSEFEMEPKRLPLKFLKVEPSKSAIKEAAVEEVIEVDQLDADGNALPEKAQVRKLLVRLDDIPDGKGGTVPGRVVAEVVQKIGIRIK
jgi:hypothetical protein